jgi:hypothetical protein
MEKVTQKKTMPYYEYRQTYVFIVFSGVQIWN